MNVETWDIILHLRNTFSLPNIMSSSEMNKKKPRKNEKKKKGKRILPEEKVLPICLSACLWERRERERETIFIDVNRRVVVDLLHILQNSSQTPRVNRELSQK